MRGWPTQSKPPALISDSMRALVEDVEVDPLAEVVEVEERPVLLPLGHDQRDEALADVAHRRQPEDDL